MNIGELTAVFEKQKEGGYIGYIAEIAGINTQGETLEEAKENLIDAFELMMAYRKEKILKAENVTTTPFIPLLRSKYEKIKTA